MIHIRKPVLDNKGYIQLIDTLPSRGLSGDYAMSMDAQVAAAARISLGDRSVPLNPEADERLIYRLMKDEHTSPFEMAIFLIKVKAPLVVLWQWARHRTFAYQSVNSESGRYTEFKAEFYTPKVWRRQSIGNKQASGELMPDSESAMLTAQLIEHYEQSYQLYKAAVDSGVAREMARLFLPGFSVYYTWLIKVDLHNLFGFLRLRMASDAQTEIREYAKNIYYHIVKPQAPICCKAFERYRLGYALED